MTMPILDMTSAVEARVHELMTQFRSRFQNTMYNVDDPYSIYYDLKGTTAGQSFFQYDKGCGYLRFNRMIMKENWEDFDRTIIHEVAHYCVSILYGQLRSRNGNRVVHGKEWKNMMLFFGLSPKRCHSYDVSNCRAKKKLNTYDYICDCTAFELTVIRHRRILGGKKYFCRKCSGELIPV